MERVVRRVRDYIPTAESWVLHRYRGVWFRLYRVQYLCVPALLWVVARPLLSFIERWLTCIHARMKLEYVEALTLHAFSSI